METEPENPFSDLAISKEWCQLLDTDGRSICSTCNKSRKYFCYTCYQPMDSIKAITPKVILPLPIDIIKHPKEIDGKSTALHAAVIAPDHVTVHTFPAIPDYSKQEKVVLVFPGKNARSLQEVVNDTLALGTGEGDNSHRIEKVVFIDSTWNQCRTILNDPRMKRLPCVVLEKRMSHFWRHQKGSPRTHLATIEAIHQFMIEYHALSSPLKKYNGEFDNLLFFFIFMYNKIHTMYNHEDLLSYKRPML